METYLKMCPLDIAKYISNDWKKVTIGYDRHEHRDFKYGTVRQDEDSQFVNNEYFVIIENKLNFYSIGIDQSLFDKGQIKFQKQMVVNKDE